MSTRRRLLACGFAAFGSLSAGLRAQPQPAHLPFLNDLRPLLAESRRTRAPLLVLFSTPGCPFCREVRDNYLMPRVVEERQRVTPRLLLAEVDITARTPLVDAEGDATTHTAFSARYGVRIVPVVMLFGERLQTLAEPLIGIDRAGFYEAFLARAIDEAQRRLSR